MATAQMPTEEEIIQMSEKLQEHFLQEHREDTLMDPRDIARVEQSLPYVAKFVRHNRGNFNNAYNHMIECLKWRKSFGILDIKFEDIDVNLWKMGMAYNHGYDRDGNHIVILNIRLHKKDSKKSMMLRKWVAFCYETHQRLYPDKKLCVVFDMEGAGLGNMDMDLIRFVVNSFKIYFPNLLAWLLVFNMPWVLQAAWKIVQSWLSEGAVSKVKFVTRESIQEYVDLDNLMVRFGGNDPWNYDYETENERMLQEIGQLEKQLKEYSGQFEDPTGSGGSSGGDDPVEFASEQAAFEEGEEKENSGEDEEEEEEREGVGKEEQPLGKKVRFTPNLPPSRQSRFGQDDDDGRVRPRNPDERKLTGGVTSTSSIRRRQVRNLMGNREGRNQRMNDPSSQESLDVSSSLPAELLRSSSSPHRRYSEPTSTASLLPLSIDPPYELVFSGSDETDILCTLTLTNVCEHPVAYKVKTTAPLRYKVRPNLALIDPRSKAVVQVLLVPGSSNTSVSQDKFLIQSHTFDLSTALPDQSRLTSFWRALPEHSIKEHRMKCRWTNGRQSSLKGASSSQQAVWSDTGAATMQPRLPPEGAKVPAQPPSPASRELQTLRAKVDLIINTNEKLTQHVHRLQTSNYMVILLLFLVLVLTCLL